jgi:hypothetical protein
LLISTQEIEDIYSRTRFLKPPSEILIFSDSAIATSDGHLALAATKPFAKDTVILTQISNETSPIHESIHRRGIINERLTAILTRVATPLVMRRRPLRKVKYQECTVGCQGCMTERQAFQEAGVKSVLGEGMPVVKHLILLE